jgi:endoglucanase
LLAWFLLPFFVGGLASSCAQVSARAQAPRSWALWESYKAHFYDPQGRVVDHDDGDRTTSEAQAYGLFFALVADDRETFDGLLRWTEDNLAAGDLTATLPAWLWGRKRNGAWGVADANPASDADLWISYTLLQAGALWDEPRYAALGKALLAQVEAREITTLPRVGPFLLPSSSGFQTPQETILNPSYVPPQVLAALTLESRNPAWRKMAEALPWFLGDSSPRGFAMDWVACDGQGNLTPSQGPGKTAGGSYDAIRVYLWAGMLANDAPRRAEILQAVSGMANYLRHHDAPPERVSGDGRILRPEANIAFSAAVLPYLAASGDFAALAVQKSRLQAQFDPAMGLFGKDHRYYTQNLAMFATGWAQSRFRFDRNGGLQVAWSKP